jgi:hypothetical protein
MRNSIFEIRPGRDITQYQLLRFNTSVGFSSGHSVAGYENHLFGRGEKGVYIFNGAAVQYIGEALEDLWDELDQSELAQLASHGLYHWPNNQYWLSVRRLGERFGKDILAFDKTVQDPLTGTSPWSLLRFERGHSYLESIDDEVTDRPAILLGTPDGYVMQMLVGDVEGRRDHVVGLSGTKGVLVAPAAGTVVSPNIGGDEVGKVVRITSLAEFDTCGNGLRGMPIRITVFDTSGATPVERFTRDLVIERNEQKALYLSSPILDENGDPTNPNPAENGTTFTIGGYGSYWSSAWLPLSNFATTKRSTFIDLDAMPSATQLEVAVANAMGGAGAHAQLIAAAFPDLATLPDGNKANLNLLYGYQPGQSLHISKRGLYLRLRFGVWGIRKPWEVLGWVLRFEEEAIQKGRAGVS